MQDNEARTQTTHAAISLVVVVAIALASGWPARFLATPQEAAAAGPALAALLHTGTLIAWGLSFGIVYLALGLLREQRDLHKIRQAIFANDWRAQSYAAPPNARRPAWTPQPQPSVVQTHPTATVATAVESVSAGRRRTRHRRVRPRGPASGAPNRGR